VARELLARTGLDPAGLDEVIVGFVGPPHDQANIARVISIRAGVPRSVPAHTVGRNCASGMQAVTSAATMIEAGRADAVMALGVEVMSGYPLIYNRKATGWFGGMMRARTPVAKLAQFLKLRPSMFAPRIALTEGLTDPTVDLIMGKTAELIAREFSITREQADAYALESHRRAAHAREAGRFARESTPYLPLGGKKGALEDDDGIRDDQSMERLAKLRPYFEKPDGVVTVGNSCGITDGATGLLVTSEERARELGLTPLARLKSWAWTGCDPERMGLGPVYASARALETAGAELSDVGSVELNEAFAVQVLACAAAFDSKQFAGRELGRSSAVGALDLSITNRNGGAIALGHPVGATGARLLLTTAHELAASDVELGLATLCIGGGQGGAVLLERAA
jgi:acetyl-CoA C-acetyltransferase/acetyl-CoA acyltransferase